MANNKLSAAKFKNLQATDKDQLISDGDSLFVSIRAIGNGGAKSFRMTYRLEGKKKWITLKASALAEARKEREAYKEMVRQGKDPSLERKLEAERNRKQQLEEQEALAKLAARMTVRALFTRWHDMDITNRKDCKEVVRMFEKDVLPLLGDMLVEDVRKGHITQITDALLARGVKRMAKLMLGLMRQMFRFAVDRGIIENDPTASIRKAKVGGKDVERDRVLEEDELRALAKQLPAAGFMKSTECAVWIALATLCRIGELSKARWADVDFGAKTWKIPETHSKNGKAHTIYLSDFALAQFKVIKEHAQHDVWLFPNRDNTSHVCDKSITKQVGGRQTDTVLSRRTKNNQALVLAGGRWTPHDLRRTGATLMVGLGVMPDVVEKCLNHTEENKMKRTYQRHDYKEEQKAAWRLLGDRLELLVKNDHNVITLKKAG